MSEFTQKIVVTVVDKGILALLVLVVGFAANGWLEAYSTNLAYQRTFAETKIAKYEDLWTSLYKYDHIVQLAVRDLKTDKKNLDSFYTELNHANEQLTNSFAKNGLYIGRDISNEIHWCIINAKDSAERVRDEGGTIDNWVNVITAAVDAGMKIIENKINKVDFSEELNHSSDNVNIIVCLE